MRKLLIALVAALVAVSAFAPATVAAETAQEAECEYPLTVTDGTGEEITLEEPPERVVALAPSDAQTVFEIGAEDTLVGMPLTPATEDLEAGDRTDVTGGDEMEIDAETVVGLEPDVVLAASITDEETVDQLRDLGVTVYHFEEEASIEDVVDNVDVTGQLTGECAGAAETTEWITDRLELLESAVDDEDYPLAYYAMGGGFTAGTGTFQHEIMTAGGLENVAENAGIEGWEAISEEVILEEDPEWLLYGDDWEDMDEDPYAERVTETTAYQEDNVKIVDSNAFNQPAPGVVYTVEDLVETVHPEAYEEIADDLEELDAAYEDDADDEGSTDDGDDETDEIPGFAAPAAIAALLAVSGLLFRRR